jgi:hypothetical protein
VTWLALAILLAWTRAVAEPAVTLRGTLVDRATRRPAAGAVIEVGNELVASNDDGTFAVSLAPGDYTLVVTAPWLVAKRQPITLGRDEVLTIEVDPAEVPAGERIEVTDLDPTAPGETTLSARLARAVPGGATPPRSSSRCRGSRAPRRGRRRSSCGAPRRATPGCSSTVCP